MPFALPDEELIRRYLLSQPGYCFETLYMRYVNKVYRKCLSLTHNHEQAEDFAHDIFIKLFDKLPHFQYRASFSTWLYAISYNHCLDQLRLAKRFKTTPLDEQLEQPLPECHETELHEEVLQLAKRALESLSLDEQTLLRLRYEQGISVDELARMYRIKISATKMRLMRSKIKMRQFYIQQQDI